MGKLTKNQKLAAEKIEAGKAYSLKEAASLVKEITFTKFDASLDIDVRLGVDPRKANQMVRGVVSLPHGTGKEVRVWYFVHRMLKLLQKKLVLTTLVLTNILKRSKVDGLILM
jgi:LSU ribosomal protein L1P